MPRQRMTMQESLIPVGPPKKRKSPRPRPVQTEEPQPSTSTSTSHNAKPETRENKEQQGNSTEEKRIPMLIRGIGVHQVIPKEATRDVLTGKVPFYLVDDKDGVTLFPAKHALAALKLDQEKVEQLEDYTCLGGHQRIFEERPKKREGMGYRRRYISPELLTRGIYWVDISIRIKALMLTLNSNKSDLLETRKKH
ncbi:uncharacterized protein Rab23 isoform X4 [Euwallacea fornicatus]|uniref:uncharacterized protein Rab23 isoform X4 n=1 Tax=Euwallacea fornicatus TaxID=995702 RepID=UPI00338E8504